MMQTHMMQAHMMQARMIRTALIGLAITGAALAEGTSTPSGLQVVLSEVIFEPPGVATSTAKQVRLRYVAGQIADETEFSFARIEQDLEWLCVADGLPRVSQIAPQIERVIVSLSSQDLAFGESAPNIVQYFDVFLVQDNTCLWEGL